MLVATRLELATQHIRLRIFTPNKNHLRIDIMQQQAYDEPSSDVLSRSTLLMSATPSTRLLWLLIYRHLKGQEHLSIAAWVSPWEPIYPVSFVISTISMPETAKTLKANLCMKSLHTNIHLHTDSFLYLTDRQDGTNATAACLLQNCQIDLRQCQLGILS